MSSNLILMPLIMRIRLAMSISDFAKLVVSLQGYHFVGVNPALRLGRPFSKPGLIWDIKCRKS